ncbi:DUF4255 domain-containing protein [Pseudonocardia broussonetiae]|uniref:DUF4255 domain-containing protein n=1 Tax=Pseudonocardia broussonetiae TaxID=2736640 RepID=A0A6M6JL83_9PSEU|nr:DUF4255 domain-containing protein [Pseudonocardia broussonetiae]QJY47953.1 DUF4255 domain-containing protein [Pseudonocardia broussonetiae]
MSTGAAVAAVTALIRIVLQGAMNGPLAPAVANFTITALPPDRVVPAETAQLNLFLYRTTPNPGWRNVELPSRSSDGSRRTLPPLAVDLHYLLSAHGKLELEAELLLGHAMAALHGMPLLTRPFVTGALSGVRPGDIQDALWSPISQSGLAEQEEVVTISMEPLSVDDLVKLWSVLGEKYRTSVAYVATVVLIRPDETIPQAPPVTEPARVGVAPLPHAVLDAVTPGELDFAADAPLTLTGRRLLVPGSQVVFGGGPSRDPQPGSTSTDVRVLLPAAVPAGLSTVRVTQPATIGDTTRPMERSNPLPLTVRPVVVSAPVVDAAGSPVVRATLTPDVAPSQEVALLLDGVPDPIAAQAHPLPTGTVDFPIAVAAGTYPARVRVDGAASQPLTVVVP